MKEKNLRVYCPNCGAQFAHGKEAVDTILSCKRCGRMVRATFNNKLVHLELMEERQMLYVNTS